MFPVCSQISSAQWKNYSHGLVRSSATDSLPIILAIPNPSAHTKWQFESARALRLSAVNCQVPTSLAPVSASVLLTRASPFYIFRANPLR
jgi:hypothetical protein